MKSLIILIAALVLLTMLDIGESGHYYKGYGYGRYRYGHYRYGHYKYHHGKRGMKDMLSRQQAVANDVHAELNDEVGIEQPKENFAEVKRNKAQ